MGWSAKVPPDQTELAATAWATRKHLPMLLNLRICRLRAAGSKKYLQ